MKRKRPFKKMAPRKKSRAPTGNMLTRFAASGAMSKRHQWVTATPEQRRVLFFASSRSLRKLLLGWLPKTPEFQNEWKAMLACMSDPVVMDNSAPRSPGRSPPGFNTAPEDVVKNLTTVLPSYNRPPTRERNDDEDDEEEDEEESHDWKEGECIGQARVPGPGRGIGQRQRRQERQSTHIGGGGGGRGEGEVGGHR